MADVLGRIGTDLGWAGFVKVDGAVYSWLGLPECPNTKKATQTAFSYTSTASTFTFNAGPVVLTARFLSPVETNSYVLQSFPFTYLDVSVASGDGAPHSVQIYSDLGAEWVSGDNSMKANWTTSTVGPLLTHQVQLAEPHLFGEILDHSQYGAAYYSTSNSKSVTYRTGGANAVRGTFIKTGQLPNTQDAKFRAIDDDRPVFAFAEDLGNIPAGPAYAVADGELEMRSSYFFSEYPKVQDGINAFHANHAAAVETAAKLDKKVQTDSEAISANYADIVALSIRQFAAGFEFTVGRGADGRFNQSDILGFMKAHVVYPSFPAVHDLGANFPNATGHSDGKDEKMPVEESGSMLILTLAYTQATKDLSLIRDYHALLDQWTEFLIHDGLKPTSQLSTDDFAGPLQNQTNLAIKGIIGIAAMAEIERLLGNADLQKNYSSIAQSYVPKFLEYATSKEKHLELNVKMFAAATCTKKEARDMFVSQGQP
ncbi:hypothetical protein RQP46_011279 [Phenoliferia psychrophenolica]